VARLVLDRGHHNVRPLEGGFDAWLAAGLPTVPLDDTEIALHAPVAQNAERRPGAVSRRV